MASSEQSCSRKRASEVAQERASESARVLRQRRIPSFLRVHVLRGKLLPDDEDAGGGSAPMDEEQWSELPEDILWWVLVMVPAATRVQLHRKWRQVLTSAEFRNRVGARQRERAAAAGVEEQRGGVVGCMSLGGGPPRDEDGANSGGRDSKLKAVDMDLSFVPTWFWKSDDYTVMAAGDGLVCISNQSLWEKQKWEDVRRPVPNEYCVINPLTRSCKVLPTVPFHPDVWILSGRAVTITCKKVDYRMNFAWMVATYDLEEEEGAPPGQWAVSRAFMPRGSLADREKPHPKFAVGDGGMYYYYERGMHFRSKDAAPASASLITFDAPQPVDRDFTLDERSVALAAHRGSVYFVAVLEKPPGPGPAMVCGVWRLVRSSMTWEALGEMDMGDLNRFTRFRYVETQGAAWGAGDWLCLSFCTRCIEDRPIPCIVPEWVMLAIQ